MASDYEVLALYIQEKEGYIDSVLERLGWDKECLEENVRAAENFIMRESSAYCASGWPIEEQTPSRELCLRMAACTCSNLDWMYILV